MFFILLFNRFFESEVFLDSFENKKNKRKFGHDHSSWPEQAIHIFENNKELNNEIYIKIQENYRASIKSLENNKNFKDSPWWIKCRKEFRDIFINDDGSLNQYEFQNFRKSKQTKAALLADQIF